MVRKVFAPDALILGEGLNTEPPQRGEKGSLVLDSSVDRRHRRELSEGRNPRNVHKKHLKDRVSGGRRLALSSPSLP